MTVDHVARARKAWPHLVRLAPKMSPCTYGEISEKIGVHWRAAAHFLSVIQEHCRNEDLPPLQALVVNKASRLPGSGYVGSSRTHAAHQRALRKIGEYRRWPPKAPF